MSVCSEQYINHNHNHIVSVVASAELPQLRARDLSREGIFLMIVHTTSNSKDLIFYISIWTPWPWTPGGGGTVCSLVPDWRLQDRDGEFEREA